LNGNGSSQIVIDPITQRNTLTGSGSGNTNVFGGNNVVALLANNNATANNNLLINAITGQNTLNNNTKVGNLLTGDINIAANLINILNVINPDLILKLDLWGISGDFNGNLVLPGAALNSLTGQNSSNQNILNAANTLSASLLQNANINNIFDFNTNTGSNNIGNNSIRATSRPVRQM
jgi:hypothetical protein